jgi:hypothetical protein
MFVADNLQIFSWCGAPTSCTPSSRLGGMKRQFHGDMVSEEEDDDDGVDDEEMKTKKKKG